MSKIFSNLLVSAPNGGGLFLINDSQVYKLDNIDTTGFHLLSNGFLRGEQPDSLWISRGKTIEISGESAGFHDIHDVLSFNRCYYVVGTNKNQIVEIDHDGVELQRWVFPGDDDSSHINCLGVWNNRIVFSAFGDFRETRAYKGKTLGAGYVQDLISGKRLIDGLSQPHSLVSMGKNIVIANSEETEVRQYAPSSDLIRTKKLDGYTRGICISDSVIYVGLSRSRNIGDGGVETATLIALSVESWEEIGRIPLPVTEIYSIELVNDARKLINVIATVVSHYSLKREKQIASLSQVVAEHEAVAVSQATVEKGRQVAAKQEPANVLMERRNSASNEIGLHQKKVSDRSLKQWQIPDRNEHKEEKIFNNLTRSASFWPSRLKAPNAWIGHIPFVAWFISEIKPGILVELGTHSGNSYLAMCQAVSEFDIGTLCYAVDTWQGDEHASYYGEEIYSELSAYHQRYAAFSSLLRMTFDSALQYFGDQTVDLLHIDGLHTYEAVKHDFESWLPKLAPGAVVLFHDTNVRERDFGVWKLWEELKIIYPDHLEFNHSHGLGVLQIPGGMESRRLSCLTSDSQSQSEIRQYFASLGALLNERYTKEQQCGQITGLNQTVADRDGQIANFTQAVDERDGRIASLAKAIGEHDEQISNLIRAVAERNAQVDSLNQAIARQDDEIASRNFVLRRIKSPLRLSKRFIGNTLHPLRAYRLIRDIHIIKSSGLIDTAYYLLRYRDVRISACDPVRHYCEFGWREGRNPSPGFATKYYLETNPDVLVARSNPLAHYVRYGMEEGRRALPDKWGETSGSGIAGTIQPVAKSFHFRGRDLISRACRFARRYVSGGARWVWQHLPLDICSKQKFKSAVFKTLPIMFRWTQAYRSWQNFNAPMASDPQAYTSLGPAPSSSVGCEYVPLARGKSLQNKSAKLICFYLPQFHPIPENNAWWGEGFTEWTNVLSAQPQFVGHYQPHLAGELGYYSLLDPAVQRRQVELAKFYGVEGFCFYFYWFGGKRLLETPTENYLNDNSLDLPFCLCWANENWSRRWDGSDSEILIAQQHSPEDDLAFIQHVARYMGDSRYIRIDGKPLLLVYRPSLLPSAKDTVQRWRKWCSSNGIGEIYLAYTQSFETVNPARYGFDAAIEFPPNKSIPTEVVNCVTPFSENFGCTVYDWRVFVERSEKYRRPNYEIFRGVCPSWDNTARRKNHGVVFLNNTPALYQRWLVNAIRDTVQHHVNPDERLIFINAWNEWAEGAHLEPDARYGYAYLQATRDALSHTAESESDSILLVTHDCHPHGAQLLTLETAKQLKVNGFKITILALGDGGLSDEFAQVGETFNTKQAGERAVQDFLVKLRSEGTLDAITSTVVSGSVVPQLKNLGFRVLSLIHELPGVIREMGQEVNAAAIAKFADKVVFPAELVNQRFREVASVDPGKVIVRPQGVLRKNPFKNRRADAYRLVCEKHKLPSDTQIVLSIGYADLRKGVDLFVEIAAQVLIERPKTTFIWIVNIGQKLERQVNARIQVLGLERRVLFVGFEREPMAYYAAASVYALPSREDPFPNVVLESTEVGVPVVAFQNASGAGDFIVEHEGRLVSYLDTADFARQVCELLAAPVERSRGGMSSLQTYALDLLHHLNGFPRISVVVPNYNYGRYLSERLDSIYRQTFPIYEVIVLDDDSSDNSVEIVKKYLEHTASEAQLIVNNNNSGSVFHQWQNGIDRCKGDLVWIAEADDLADSQFLSELCLAFRDPDLMLSFSQSKQIDENGKVLALNYLEYTKDISDCWLTDYVHDGHEEISEALSIKNTIPNVSAVLFRREAVEKAIAAIGEDLFNYRVAGDWLVYLHVLLQGKVYYSRKSLNLHRRHTCSVTNATEKLSHLEEVCRLQEIARRLAAPSNEALAKANAYIERLHEHFGIA